MSSIDDAVKYKVRDQVCNRVWGQISSQVSDQVCYKVLDQFEEQS